MTDICIALISGGMALLGVVISSFLTQRAEHKKHDDENRQYIRKKKEEVYRLISEFILTETSNLTNRNFVSYQKDSTEMLAKNIEILMTLYIPQKVCKQFRKTVEALDTDLPPQIVQARLDELRVTIREDIGLTD
ncbi:MAG: hypothetical protein PUD76_04410 [Clostridia bacterium]|nr:hypothetical protein [Clostridia bacterium]